MATVGASKPAGKKLTITLSKKRSETAAALADENFDQTWEILTDFIAAVHGLRATKYSLQELYAAVESLVSLRHGAELYDRVISQCKTNINELILSASRAPPDVLTFLGTLENCWTTHCSQMIMIRNVFLYLDRTYVRDTAGVRSLWDMGVQLFADALTTTGEVLQRTVSAFISAVSLERNGEQINRSTLSTLSRMFTAVRLYSTRLEPELLRATEEYYDIESTGKIAALDIPTYMLHCEKRLQEEKDRVLSVFDATSLKALMAIVETQLIADHKLTILDRGFTALVEHLRLQDLARLYSLLARVQAVEDLRKRFADHTKAKAQSLSAEESEEKDKRMVEDLLSFKEDMDNVIKTSFANNETFSAALKNAMEFAVNSRESKPAELIAKHLDALLRGGLKAAKVSNDDEFDAVLDKVMSIFRCIHGKDVFEAFYKKDLGKRLLLDKSASLDMEKSMVAKLKTECGSSFTSKMEGMFKDTNLSQELMAQFKSSKFAKDLPMEVYVNVLTSSYWPQYAPSSVNIPEQFMSALGTFEEFYQGKYSKSRKLQWHHQLGRCILTAHFPAGRKELEVSFHQARVLLLFNEMDDTTLGELRTATGLEDGELKATLVSLSMGKVKVLTKGSPTKDLGDTERFTYNATFKDPLYRLKINAAQIKESKQEADATHARVHEDRQYQLDAALVRIMKSRKTMQHQLLIGEVFAQLRFPAKAQDVKKRIESLIERDYLERDDADPSTYHYVA